MWLGEHVCPSVRGVGLTRKLKLSNAIGSIRKIHHNRVYNKVLIAIVHRNFIICNNLYKIVGVKVVNYSSAYTCQL